MKVLGIFRFLWVVPLLLALPLPALAAAGRVSVQPIAGAGGAGIRKQLATILRNKGYRVVTDVPEVSGTGQYYTWARDHALRAFVATELVKVGKKRRLTVLVWSGHDGSVVGRWTVRARPRGLSRRIAREFWRRLGPALRRSRFPNEMTPVGPAAPMRIDASYEEDEAVIGINVARRQGPLLRPDSTAFPRH